MTINLSSLRKLETPPPSELAVQRADGERVVVMVRLRKGSKRPSYVCPRAEFSPELFSAEISASDLRLLDRDPSVEAVSISKELPLIR